LYEQYYRLWNVGDGQSQGGLESKAIMMAASILPTSGQKLLHPLHNIRSQKPKPSATPGHMPIDALSAGVGLEMVNPKAALESKVTAAVAPKFHRQPRLRGHPLHNIRSQEPGPSLSPAPMIIVAFFFQWVVVDGQS
jgi:hypothetical protein